jgi:hypothetical protein
MFTSIKVWLISTTLFLWKAYSITAYKIYSLLRPSVISSISLLIIYLLVSNIAIARTKGKIGLDSLLYCLSGFSLYIIVLVDSLLSIKSGSRFLNPVGSLAIPCS